MSSCRLLDTMKFQRIQQRQTNRCSSCRAFMRFDLSCKIPHPSVSELGPDAFSRWRLPQSQRRQLLDRLQWGECSPRAQCAGPSGFLAARPMAGGPSWSTDHCKSRQQGRQHKLRREFFGFACGMAANLHTRTTYIIEDMQQLLISTLCCVFQSFSFQACRQIRNGRCKIAEGTYEI